MIAEKTHKPAWLTSRWEVAFTICFHSLCAIASTLVTKAALNSLDSPILLLTLQTMVQVGMLTAIGVPMQLIKPFKPLAVWKTLLPLTIARAIGILGKTFCLAAVDAAFYQVARGLLLPFTLLLSFAFLRPTPVFPAVALVGVAFVMMGSATGLCNDFNLNLTNAKGVVLGVASSFTTSVESVVVKRYLKPANRPDLVYPDGQDDPNELGVWQTVWMSNILSLVFFFYPLLIISGNASTLATLLPPNLHITAGNSTFDHANKLSNTHFLPLAFLTGCIGFLLTIATFTQIKVTSPTTHTIVTATRGVAQSSLAVVFLRETITVGRISSMGFILGGSILYGWAKDRFLHKGDRDAQPRLQLGSVKHLGLQDPRMHLV